MDTLVRKKDTFQVDEPHDKSNKVHHMQRTIFCRAEMTHTGEFTEGLERQKDSFGTDRDGRDSLQAVLKGNNSMKMTCKEDEPDFREKA